MPLTAGRLRCVRPYALLVGLCLVLYLPGISTIPPLDRDEARFAQATRQMLETGDFVRIRFQDNARNKKPAGIHWLQAASVSVFSTPAATAMWPYRLPSLLGATSAVILTFVFGAALFAVRERPRRIGVIAAVLLASALGVVAEAHIAKTDAALLAAVMAAQGALGLAYVRARTGRHVPAWIAVVFWAAEIAAILLKGPPGPVLAIVTAAALSIADGEVRWMRGLRPLPGLIALVAALTPWLVAIERASDGRFLSQSLGEDLLLKLIGAQESHGAPPFSYLVSALVSFWPGSLLLVPAIARGWQRHEMPAERFLLAWLVPAWVLLELVPTKLPHYVLPLFPALALLAGAALADAMRAVPAIWERWFELAVRGLWVIATFGLGVLLVGLPFRFGDGFDVIGLAGGVLLVVLGAALLYFRPGPVGTTATIAALAIAFVLPAALSIVPGLDRLWLSRGAAELVARHSPSAKSPPVSVGYSEPSLVFLLGTGLRMASPRTAAELLAGGGEALVSGREDTMFRLAIGARGLNATPLGSVPGLDYSNGQRMVLTLYAVTPR